MPLSKVLETEVGSVLREYIKLIKKGKTKRLKQIQYLLACYEALANQVPILIEGPTGLGKTFALILACLLFLRGDVNGRKHRLVYCSRTHTQLNQFMGELKSVLEETGDIESLSARAHTSRSTLS